MHDKSTNLSIPYGKISIHNNTILTGMDGCALIDSGMFPMTVSAIGYQDTVLIKKTSQIQLTPYWGFQINNESGRDILKQTFKRSADDPESKQPFTYSTYNKLIVSSTDVKSTRNKALKYLRKLPKSYRDTSGNHHLMLSESVTHRYYLDPLHDEEVIVQSRLTGTDNANLITANSQFNSLSLYKPFLLIFTKYYTNPLYVVHFNRYRYQLEDTVNYKGRSTLIISFSPKKTAHFDAVKGFYAIDSASKAIVAAVFYPALNMNNEVSYSIGQSLSENRWFPSETNLTLAFDNVDPDQTLFLRTHSTIKIDTSFCSKPKRNFSDISIYHDPDSTRHHRSAAYWDQHRTIPFTKRDQNTLSFFDQFGSINQFGKYIQLGENLYFKEVTLPGVNLKMKDMVRFNEYEGVRVGLGGYTNSSLSKRFSFKFRYGYGFKDQESKVYGGFTTNFHKRTNSSFSLSYENDVFESARPWYLNDKPMYGTEWLRRLKVGLFDKAQSTAITFNSHPVKYLDVQTKYAISNVTPKYNYQYNGTKAAFHLNHIELALKYAFGQTYFKLEDRKIPFDSKYPVIYLVMDHGFSQKPNGLNYHSLKTNLEYKLKSASFGESLFQLSAGIVSKDAPYFKMFNGKGSRGILTVAHNSFETMSYYEYSATSFVNFFYTHNFGTINFLSVRGFKPKAHIAFNAGWGWNQSTALHEGVPLKPYEKGYYEVGGLIKNLIQIQVNAIKAGFGIGLYQRIGSYASPGFFDNSKIKIATTFTL